MVERSHTDDVERDPIHAAATEWFMRLLDGNLTLEDTLAWQQWMAADPRHADAFRRMEDLWRAFEGVPIPPRSAQTEITLDTYDGSTPVSVWRACDSREGLSRDSPRRWRAMAIAASLFVAVAGLALLAFRGRGWLDAPPPTAVVETAVGQNRAVRLADGSVVQLGGHTRLEVSFGRGLRQIGLVRGEAFFSVAKDPARPFLVRAGAATVTAVGTEFNVRRANDRVVVSVIEGRVLVQPMARVLPVSWVPISRPVGAAAAVSAGHRATVDPRGIESSAVLADATTATGWQHGRLAFEAEPLRDVVEDVNRYATKPIVIADDRTASLSITGTVSSDDVAGWVSSLEKAFGIRSEEQPAQIVLHKN